MMQPKRTKFRKQFKGRISGSAQRGNSVAFGEYGLKATDRARMTAREIEAARRAISRYGKYKKGAASRGLDFNISFEEFMLLWQKPCYYCGSSIETIGIDRIDNSIGYMLGNIIPSCFVCNRAKMDMSQSEFLSHCSMIVRHLGL